MYVTSVELPYVFKTGFYFFSGGGDACLDPDLDLFLDPDPDLLPDRDFDPYIEVVVMGEFASSACSNMMAGVVRDCAAVFCFSNLVYFSSQS